MSLSQTDPDVDDGRRHHDAYALEQVSHNVDEGGADAGVAVGAPAEECVAVAVDRGAALAILINLVIAAAVSVEGGGVMEDVGHATRGEKTEVKIWAATSGNYCFLPNSVWSNGYLDSQQKWIQLFSRNIIMEKRL